MPLALHAPLPPLPLPQGARLGPHPFPSLLRLSWQLLAGLQQRQGRPQSPFLLGGFFCAPPADLGARGRGCHVALLPLSRSA